MPVSENDFKITATLLHASEFGCTVKIIVQSYRQIVAIANFHLLAEAPFMSLVYEGLKLEKSCAGQFSQHSPAERFCAFAISAMLTELYAEIV